MQVNINGNMRDISMILVSAERYALGRRTYIVQWTCFFIINNMHLLSENDRQVMIMDLENAIDYGDECDRQQWKMLSDKLKEKKCTE